MTLAPGEYMLRAICASRTMPDAPARVTAPHYPILRPPIRSANAGFRISQPSPRP